MFSRSVGLEYRQHGIDIQCQVLSSFLSFFQGINIISFSREGEDRRETRPGRQQKSFSLSKLWMDIYRTLGYLVY
jgi:hypothetical protein